MKRLLAAASIAALILAALALNARVAAEEKTRSAELTGTVVDLHCYVTHGIRDASHTACANACIARGVPAGLLADDGTLYLLFEEKPFSVKDRVAGLADVSLRVKGVEVTRGGMRGIQVATIERLKP